MTKPLSGQPLGEHRAYLERALRRHVSRFVGYATRERDDVLALHADFNRRVGERFIPVKPTVDAALHTELVDRFANVGPALTKFVAQIVEAAIDRFTDPLAESVAGTNWIGCRALLCWECFA